MSDSCPVCEAESLENFFSIKQVPVIINILSNTRGEALGRPRGDIDLGFCGNCGHIYNTSFDLSLLDYSGEYDNALHFSSTFRDFASQLVDTIVNERHWKGSNLLEVGCGKASFLQALCKRGGNSGIGYDPSIEDQDWTPVGPAGGKIKLVRGYFGKEDVSVPGDKIICQHVLEHIEAPADFLQDIIASRKNSLAHSAYFEVPNVLYSLRDSGVWDIIYEHCSYFSPTSLAFLFNRFGYAVDSCEEVYGNQFLSLHAEFGAEKRHLEASDLGELTKLVSDFSQTFKEKSRDWRTSLEPALSGEKKVVVWGAGSKGITFLNMMTDGKGIDYIIDQNPAKIGKFVAGSGQEIQTPEFLVEYRPDMVIVMNPLYKDEIAHKLAGMGLTPEVVVA